MSTLLDISVPVGPRLPVWPGEAAPLITHKASMKNGDDANVTHVAFGSHTGTHMDAPLHFVNGGKTTVEISLEKLTGPCQVIDFQGKTKITADDLSEISIQSGIQKLLFKTDNSRLWEDPTHPFYEDFCALTADAARWVVDHGIHLVGIDYLSIQRYHDPYETHVVLLSAEVVIVETLDLRFVEPGVYRLICLPLKMQGVEGVPVRAVLESL